MSNSTDRRSGAVRWYLWPLVLPAALAILLPLGLLALLSIILMPFLILAHQRRERRFAQRMREQGRFIAWQELEPRLQAGDGTLVIEQAQKNGIRVWWTQDEVARQAPTQPPAQQDLDYLRFAEPHPFVSWCFARYLCRDSGKASLTDPPYSYPPGFIDAAFFKDRFPKLSVVMTVKLA
jgi:hypothetical protein